MRALRIIGSLMLWLLAIVGILSGALWVANKTGHVQPLIVVSGSMEPGIMTGDLIFTVPKAAGELQKGEVITVMSERTAKLVTHRIVEIKPAATVGDFEVRMKGDNNSVEDSEVYTVSGDVFTPAFQVTGGGYILDRIAKPRVAIPIGVTVIALIGLSFIGKPEDDEEAAEEQPTTVNAFTK